VTSVNAQRAPGGGAAEAAVARLAEMSPDDSWARAGAALIAAADEAGDEPASHVHVATEDGEAFAVRHEGLVMVAVAERFTLASLMIFDMRAVLRDLAKDGG
jgi:hypothetical protein